TPAISAPSAPAIGDTVILPAEATAVSSTAKGTAVNCTADPSRRRMRFFSAGRCRAMVASSRLSADRRGEPRGERRVTMPIFHYAVLTDAKPGRLDEFEEWYDQQHLKDVVAVPGVRSAKRYRLISKITEQVERAPWCSLAIYEIDADDPVEATRKLSALA